MTISGPPVIIPAGLAKYITIAVTSGFPELTKVWGELLLYFTGLPASLDASCGWELCVFRIKLRRLMLNQTQTQSCTWGKPHSVKEVKFIDSVLYPYPQNCLLYHVHMQTLSSFKKRTENCRILFRGWVTIKFKAESWHTAKALQVFSTVSMWFTAKRNSFRVKQVLIPRKPCHSLTMSTRKIV